MDRPESLSKQESVPSSPAVESLKEKELDAEDMRLIDPHVERRARLKIDLLVIPLVGMYCT